MLNFHDKIKILNINKILKNEGNKKYRRNLVYSPTLPSFVSLMQVKHDKIILAAAVAENKQLRKISKKKSSAVI